MRLRLLWMLLVLVLSACSTSSRNRQTAQASNSKDKIAIALGWKDNATGFDPTLGWGFHDPPLFQSTLLRRDENLNLVNDLAQSYTLSNDRKVWTFKIRRDARFSDGKPLTAEDVAYTFNKTKESPGMADVQVLDKAVATSIYEVELRLKKPQSTFISRITYLGIVPKHAHGKNYGRNPIGSGPYRLVQWNEGQQMIIEPNPYYYGKQPAIKRLVFVFTKEGDVIFSAAKAGAIQLAHIPPFLAKQAVPGMKLHIIKSDSSQSLTFPYVPDTGRKTSLGYPIGNNVTANRAIRQAVNYAIDRKALVTGILEGYGSPSYGPATELPWDQPTAVISDGNPDKARQILADAGWKDSDGDGVLEKGGTRATFTILYPSNNNTSQGLVLAVAQMLKPVGIQVNVEGKSLEDLHRRRHKDVRLGGWGTNDPLELYFLYHSDSAQGDWRNSGYYSNQSVDQKLDQAMAAASQKEALELWRAAQWDGQTGPITQGDAASAWLVKLHQTYLINSCLDIGRPTQNAHNNTSSILANITEWKWVCH